MIPPLKQINRYLKAKSLDVKFVRTKTFQIPQKISYKNSSRNLVLPNTPAYVELFRDVILDDEYYLNNLKRYDIKNIVDVGANLGIFSIAARIAFPDSTIHAYEPNPENIPYLSKNGNEFSYSFFNEAVSCKNGKASLSFSTKHDTSASISQREDGSIIVSGLEKVINRFSTKSVDLLKLDCEGSEFTIIQNSNVLNKVKFITLEYHLPLEGSEQKLSEFYQLLSKKNFSIIKQNRTNICLGNILAKNDG